MSQSDVLPSLRQFLDVLNLQITPALLAQGFRPSVINAREALANVTAHWTPNTQKVPQVWDGEIASKNGGYTVPVRLYHPSPNEQRPVLVWLHGGGGMCGSVSVYEPILHRLALHTGCLVVAPEYRLAPENPFPAGQDDTQTVIEGVLDWLSERQFLFEPLLAIGGDSAGGALASHYMMQHQNNLPAHLKAQILVYPNVDFCMQSDSIQTLGQGYFLTQERIAWYFEHYFQQGEDYCAMSALHGPISNKIVPTLVLTAGFDPLRDEGEDYAAKLQSAGVTVSHHRYDALIHAYLNLEGLCEAECLDSYKRIDAFLKSHLKTP